MAKDPIKKAGAKKTAAKKAVVKKSPAKKAAAKKVRDAEEAVAAEVHETPHIFVEMLHGFSF